MSYREMARRLAALEAGADAAHDEHAGAAALLAAKLEQRAAMLEGMPFDVSAAPFVDLVLTGHYAEAVRRIDTWPDVSPSLARLDDQLRRLVREGETL